MATKTTLLAAAAGLALALPASADNRSWVAPVSGNFTTSGNWTPSSVPGSTDRATFDQSGNYIVTFTNPATTNSELSVRNDQVYFNLSGRTYSLTSTAATCFSIGGSVVGHGSTGDVGELIVMNSAAGAATLTTTNANIGGTAGTGGSGTVRVRPNVTWNNSGFMFMGSSAQGSLYLEGGDVNTFASVIGDSRPGSVTVNQSTSALINTASLDVAGNSDGSLSVSNGGLVRDTESIIGAAAGVTGQANVSGAGSRWENNGLFTLGLNGTAILQIGTGGYVHAGIGAIQCSIADGSGSSGFLTVTGANSRMYFVSGPTHFGRMGAANVYIGTGGRVDHTNSAYLASHPLGSCNATVIGVGSRWIPGQSMYVGGTSAAPGGTAMLTLSNYGLLQIGSAGTLKIWNAGTVTLNGGIIQTGTFSNSGTLDWISGTFQLLSTCAVGAGGPFGATPVISTGRILQAANFTIDGNAATSLNVPGGTVISDFDFVVGSSNQGAASLTANGQLISRNLTIGNSASSTGALTADGSGTHLNLGEFPFNQDMYVGKAGTGAMTVSGGALATVAYNPFNIGNDAGSHGTVTITGAASQLSLAEYFLSVGRFGTGTIDVLAGARLNGTGLIAENTGATGTVRVSGAGSIWTSQSVTVGSGGAGTLIIENGASVTTGDLATTLGAGSSAQVTLTGQGSTLTSTPSTGHYGQIIIGGAAAASMLIDQGAIAQGDECFIGDGNTAVGTITLRNGAQLNATEELDVAYNGRGTLVVESNADVSTNQLTIGLRNASQGDATVTGAGSTLSCTTGIVGGGMSGLLTIGTGGLAQCTGTFVVQSSGTVSLTGGTLAAGYLNHGGMLSGTGIVAGNFTNAGNISPGNSPGQINVQGAYTQAANGVLNIELGGTTPGTQHDRLAVSGTAALGGTLNVTLVSGYQVPPGASFTILTASSITGTFATVSLPSSANGSLKVIYGPNSVTITSCYANCDGSSGTPRLTANDFTCFINAYASGQPYANCDGSSGTPVLTANDFLCFINAYAGGCS